MNDSDTELKKVVLRDIEPVLRQKLGDKVIVDDFTATSLLPPGENYGSTIMSVEVELRMNKTAKKENIYLIAKMLPPSEYQRRIFNSARTFTKEIFMYETIMPAYNKLEIECGLKKNENFDVLAKFYGSRLSLHPDADFDDNAVILLDNLKVKGYYTGDRLKGYDLDHSKVAIKVLARFHALGIATKQKKPGMFEVFKMYAKPLDVVGDADNMFRPILDKIKEDPDLNLYYDRCHKVITGLKLADLWSDVHREPWTTIIHCDFWVNNVMFHRKENGEIDDVKFVDFQIYLYGSPVRELIFYLFSSVSDEVTDDELEGLMDLYFESLVNELNRLGCDTSKFTKESYHTKMNEDAPREFLHLCFMLKVMTMDVKESNFDYDKMENVIVEYGGSQQFIDRLRKLVLYFSKHDWI